MHKMDEEYNNNVISCIDTASLKAFGAIIKAFGALDALVAVTLCIDKVYIEVASCMFIASDDQR